ncbi:MAG: hypothetical protein NC311_11545 [Muribaculaceae bacterium]|nr:hypothetical protein [Muribaculaceae bacterium]
MICVSSRSDEKQRSLNKQTMPTKKELLEQSQKAIGEYFRLSKYLFSDDAPQDVNEIPEDNPFYPDARDIADEMGLDWENMSHADSNRVMLNLLSSCFYGITPDPEMENYKPVLTVSFTKPE